MSFTSAKGEPPQAELHPAGSPELSTSELRRAAADASYSALFRLRNNNPQVRLVLRSAYCDGSWIRRPPAQVRPNSESLFCCMSDTFCWGVEGDVLFKVLDFSCDTLLCELKVSFDVPAIGPNRVNVEHPHWLQLEFASGSGDHPDVTICLLEDVSLDIGEHINPDTASVASEQDTPPSTKHSSVSECSLCGARFLCDKRYRIVRCSGCGEELLVVSKRLGEQRFDDSTSTSEDGLRGKAYLTGAKLLEPDGVIESDTPRGTL